ncbi:MAG: hypothetical protein ACYDAG_15785, partial [Chloroflexota bacterium]
PTPSEGTVARSTYSSGGSRSLSILDGVLLWILLPGLILGAAEAVRRVNPALLALLAYLLIVGFALGLAILNFGTLFRLRLEAVLPAVMLASYGWATILRYVQSEPFQKRTHLHFHVPFRRSRGDSGLAH